MARVQPDEIVYELRSEFRRALEEAVNKVIPNAKFDSHELYRACHRAVRRKCSSWEQISNRYIDK